MTPRTPRSARPGSRSAGRPPAGPRSAPAARRWLVDFRRALRRHRRKLAVLATIAAVLTGLTALAPPQPATVTVLGAAHLLPAGSTIAADDLDRIALPPDAVPIGAVTEPAELIGQQVAGPVPERQALTASSLLRNRSSGSMVVAPLPLADDRVSALIKAGDVIDVFAVNSESGKTRLVASAVRVVTGPTAPPDDTGGPIGAGESGGAGGLVLVEVSPSTATALAAAAATSVLGIVWR